MSGADSQRGRGASTKRLPVSHSSLSTFKKDTSVGGTHGRRGQKRNGTIEKNISPRKRPTRDGSATVHKKQRKSVDARNILYPLAAVRASTLGKSHTGIVIRTKTSRIAMDVAISRLQRWFRVIILQRIIRHRGLLTARTRKILDVQISIWKLRVRIAKRILSEALTAYAISLRSGTENMHKEKQARFITLITSFMRTKNAMILISKSFQSMQQRAVNIIERAWITSALFQHLQRLSMVHKAQRLFMQQENIERRDYIRQWLLFLVDCHQRFYNNPLLMNAGISVRSLTRWEHVVMDVDENFCENMRSSSLFVSDIKLMNLLAQERTRSTTVAMTSFDVPSIRCSSVIQGYMSSCQSKGRLSKIHERTNFEPICEDLEKCYFYKRSEAAFVQGLLQEMGYLDFQSSTGGRPRLYWLPECFSDGVVVAKCTGRLQNVEYTCERVKNKFVLMGGAFVRNSLQSLPILKELCLHTQLREAKLRRHEKLKFILGVNADSVDTRFFHPIPRRKNNEDIMKAAEYSLSTTAMGKTWIQFYHSINLNKELLDINLMDICGTHDRLNSTSVDFLRGKTYFISRNGERSSLHLFIGSDPSIVLTNISRTPTTGSIDVGLMKSLPIKTFFGSEFDIKYEIERLFIREHSHRLKVKDDQISEMARLEWIMQREQMTYERRRLSKMREVNKQNSPVECTVRQLLVEA